MRAAQPLIPGSISQFAFVYPDGWGCFWDEFAGVASDESSMDSFHCGLLSSRGCFGVGSRLRGVHRPGPAGPLVGQWQTKKRKDEWRKRAPCRVNVVADLATSHAVRLTFYCDGVAVGVGDSGCTLELPPGSASAHKWYPAAQTPAGGRTIRIECSGDW